MPERKYRCGPSKGNEFEAIADVPIYGWDRSSSEGNTFYLRFVGGSTVDAQRDVAYGISIRGNLIPDLFLFLSF